jgi:hypothetical protein
METTWSLRLREKYKQSSIKPSFVMYSWIVILSFLLQGKKEKVMKKEHSEESFQKVKTRL